MPRLLFLCERFAPDLGGVGASSARTARAIAALGVEVYVVAWSRTLPAGVAEITIYPAEHPQAGSVTVQRLGLFANLDFSLQHTLTLFEGLHAERAFDAVWGHYLFPAGFVAVLFAESVGIPATVSARGNDIDMLMFPPGDFARLQWTLQRARVISTVSNDLAKKVRILLGEQRTVQVIANNVDTDVFQPAAADGELRAALGIEPAEAVLGFSGELRHKKGLTHLLQTLVEVQRARPACLLVIGEVRVRDQVTLASFAAEHPAAAARLIVTGHLEDPRAVARHLQLCDVFLHPSVWDGMPNAVLEAMACQRVVLASDAGGIPEVVEHGHSGFIVPRRLLARFGEATLEVLALDKVEREAIGRTARNRLIAQFSAVHEETALVAILTSLGVELPTRVG